MNPLPVQPIKSMLKFQVIFAAGLLLGGSLKAQPGPFAEVVFDFLKMFPAAFVTNCASCEVRRPASAGSVKQPGLFAHPAAANRPARVEYDLRLPEARAGERLFLAFDVALADGIKLGPAEDGVRFAVELDGRRMFAREVRQTRWDSHGVELTPFAGRSVRLALVTEAVGNTSYDWSTWGMPRVLRFRDAHVAESTGPGRVRISAANGALAFQYPARTNLTIHVKSLDGGAVSAWSFPENQPGEIRPRWCVKDLSASDGRGLILEWEPAEALALADLLLAPYLAEPRMVRLGATRAVIMAGDRVPLRLEVTNDGRGRLEENQARVTLRAKDEIFSAQPLPALDPGASWTCEWPWNAPRRPGVYNLSARLESDQGAPSEETRTTVAVFAEPDRASARRIENRYLRLEFIRDRDAFAFARVFARQGDSWAEVAVWRPLARIIALTTKGEETLEIRPQLARSGLGGESEDTLSLTGTVQDGERVAWRVNLRVKLEPDRPLARLHYECRAAETRLIKAWLGPNLYLGDGSTGAAKTWGLFPGLEYLFGAEPSSNERDLAPNLADRRTPHSHKLTAPLMAVTIGPDSQTPPPNRARFFTPDSLKDQPLPAASLLTPHPSLLTSAVTVALLWNPLQKWDGAHRFPSPRFASPNFDEGMRNHRLALFLPSVPDSVVENGERASPPYTLPKGNTLTLEAGLVVAPGPATVALREWLRDKGGLPQPHPWPRTFQEQLDLCRAGFLKTVWDEKTEKSRHCIDWAPAHAPGFAALLWLDAQVAQNAEARRLSGERAQLIARNVLRDGGPGSLTSPAGCHIMQWELPFLLGYLPEAMTALEDSLRHLIQSQQPDGGWRYEAGNAAQADLGQKGDSVLGTCANRAATLLRYARITGDKAVLAAGEKALRFMEQFRVPRGGQTWECPMYEPDILAAAYAIRAYHDAWRATGNPRWLHNAVYWAETGVPFIYLWTLPDKPMMLGAVIPVFGSTFYTHSWLAMPVQWCGLVYAYHLLHLAQDLVGTPLTPVDSPLPLGLHFSPADWNRLVELITVSAMYQQFDTGPRLGSYPDSISNFEQRNPAFLNPEDILVNVLALQGHDPDVKTARLTKAGRDIVVSSAAAVENLQSDAAQVRFRLRFFAGERSHTLVAGLKPKGVRVNGQHLSVSPRPLQREPGWWWDQPRSRLYLTVQHDQPEAMVVLESDLAE